MLVQAALMCIFAIFSLSHHCFVNIVDFWTAGWTKEVYSALRYRLRYSDECSSWLSDIL